VLARGGIAGIEQPLRQGQENRLYPAKRQVPELVQIGVSGTVRHIRHIPMVQTGCRVGVRGLGRCWRIGPASCSGAEFAREGLGLLRLERCQLASKALLAGRDGWLLLLKTASFRAMRTVVRLG